MERFTTTTHVSPGHSPAIGRGTSVSKAEYGGSIPLIRSRELQVKPYISTLIDTGPCLFVPRTLVKLGRYRRSAALLAARKPSTCRCHVGNHAVFSGGKLMFHLTAARTSLATDSA